MLYRSFSVLCLILFVFSDCSNGRATDSSDGESVCKRNEDCDEVQVCADQKCIDPCQLNVCGPHTNCHVSNHVPLCACEPGHTGHPFTGCTLITADDETPSASSVKPREKKYHLFLTKKNWFQALAYCSSQNMRLATITSQEENDRLVNQVKDSNQKNSVNWWIGGSDLENAGDYCWTSSGTNFTFKNFPPLQPDNHVYPNKEREGCLELRTVWNYQWNDFIYKKIDWWLGASDLEEPGNFRWTSAGSVITFSDWGGKQPDNLIYPNGQQERCLELKSEWNYKWNDFICEQYQSFVCEQNY